MNAIHSSFIIGFVATVTEMMKMTKFSSQILEKAVRHMDGWFRDFITNFCRVAMRMQSLIAQHMHYLDQVSSYTNCVYFTQDNQCSLMY